MESVEVQQRIHNDYKSMLLEFLKTDPKFKEQFKELLNKQDNSDKDIQIFIGLPIKEIDNSERGYTINTTKRISEYSGIPIQSISVSKNLLKSLYKQLIELDKRGEL